MKNLLIRPYLPWYPLIFLLAANPLWAHADVEIRIAELTRRIQKHPTDAGLYLKRGELHRLHGEYSAALSDYWSASQLDMAPHLVNLCTGKLLAKVGQPVLSLAALDRCLALRPDEPNGYISRARLLGNLGQYLAAFVDYTQGIAGLRNQSLSPDYYLERARILSSLGDEYIDEVLQGLDEGLEKLGQPLTLQLCAIDLELQRHGYQAALKRLDSILERSPRKEIWLVRRGEILLKARKDQEALSAFQQALEAIESLPARYRKIRTSVELEGQIREAISKITHRKT